MWLVALIACGDGVPPSPSADDFAPSTISEAQVDPEEKLRILEGNAARKPESSEAWLWLAREYRDRKDPRAESTYEKAVETGPTDAVARIELAWMRIEGPVSRGIDPPRADLERAEALVREAVGLEGATCEHRHALVGLFELELDGGWVAADARSFLESSLATCAGTSYEPYWQAALGRVHGHEGRAAEAVEWTCRGLAGGNLGAAKGCFALLGESGHSRACEALGAGREAAKTAPNAQKDARWQQVAEKHGCAA